MKFKTPDGSTVSLATTQGGHTHAVTGEYATVPLRFRGLAIEKGCVYEGQSPEVADISNTDDLTNAALVLAAVRKMIADPKEGDFTGGGQPNATALSKLVGFTVTKEQRDAAWDAASKD